MAELSYRPIGVIHTPFKDQEDTPIQPVYATGSRGTLEIASEYVGALQDLEGFERIWVLYHCHRARAFSALVVPYRDDAPRGLFATRAPARPNPIGLSVLRLLGIDGVMVHVADVDVLDGTPLLDIKPYVPAFDAFPDAAAGWLDAAGTGRTRADRRFE
jgi:tRNA-Thr(GGU) m(6)t(6)A37 methyltransferase TsaA